MLVEGWIHTKKIGKSDIQFEIRSTKGELYDVTLKRDDIDVSQWKTLVDLPLESSLRIEDNNIHIFHVARNYPHEVGIDDLKKRHITIRRPALITSMRCMAFLLREARQWFYDNDWMEVTPPNITNITEACEDLSTLFDIDYFGRKANLCQTTQLHLEALIFSLKRVYSITRCFRKEFIETTRHLTEYTHIEGEAAFCSFFELKEHIESLVVSVIKGIQARCCIDIPFDFSRPFYSMSYDKAIELLFDLGHKIEWGSDLGFKEEKMLSDYVKKIFFIHSYPYSLKAFYMKRKKRGSDLTLSMDLLFPNVGEVIGAGEREYEIDALNEQIAEQLERVYVAGGKPEDYDWYLDLRKYGSVPHSGFGMGAERMIMCLYQIDDIKKTTPFPRTSNHFFP
jgi:asparaginyl-tRNA synthetase